MAVKFIIEDEFSNELQTYINTNEQIYLSVGDRSHDFYFNGHICLSKEDAKELVKELNKLIKQL